MDVVVPLHEELERGATTENEETFQAREETQPFVLSTVYSVSHRPFPACKLPIPTAPYPVLTIGRYFILFRTNPRFLEKKGVGVMYDVVWGRLLQ